ncbi:MAG: hypothetical protein JO062_28700 [Bryobacterales bacterium]|nr:hypothetical protein [Bryobacterales bacterium]
MFYKGVSWLGLAALFSASLSAQQPSIKSGGVISAGAFGAFSAIAPGSWIEIYGSNLAGNTRSWSSADFSGVNAPTSLDGTSVTIGGQKAFVDYISPGQVNAQVPSTVGSGSQGIVVATATGATVPYTITVNAVEPGFLAPPSFKVAGNQYVVALFSDGAYVLPPGAVAGVTSRRAQPGDTITLYGVGFGPVAPNTPAGQIVQQNNALTLPFKLSFGSTNAPVTYDGLAPSAVGLYQFNVTVPSVSSSDLVPLTFTLNGANGSQTLYIAVQNSTASVAVSSLTLSPSSVDGGGTVQGTLTLSAPAPSGGVVVALSSSSGSATMPTTVTVPAGSVAASFTIATAAVSSNQTATITASYAGSSAQAMLTVTVPSGFPQFSTLLSISTPASAPIYIGISLSKILGNYHCALQAGLPPLTSLTGLASFSTFAMSDLSFTCTGVDITASTMFDKLGNMAQITSGSLSVTLTPEVVSTSGTATGTYDLVSTLGTISGSFSGTYTAK